MKKKLISDLNRIGIIGNVRFERLDTHAVRYEVKANGMTFDDGYFTTEKDSPNSKEAMLLRWEKFLISLKP